MRSTAIYVRQSVERPDSVSLETQEALCRSELPPETPVTVYSDAGYSGKNTARPALHALMQAVRSDKIGTVLVYKLDRISRNLADFTQLLRIFAAHRVEFRSHTEHFETATPLGQAMQSLLMVFAQLERETISGRVRDAAFARAKQGLNTGGPPPAGFQRIPAEIG
ncbi:MAG: recombinase family protein, partial [Oscillospiraceae bacterium]|nr:recombinase family protein [Oscillospiraceae bacterium]MBP0989195.1 recombinase family protein [Oscillospiraceae bacterium]